LIIGVLGIQGDFREHLLLLKREMGTNSMIVKKAKEIDEIDGLIIPGGESTTITKLSQKFGLLEAIQERKIPVMGTCAGAILLSREVINHPEQYCLGLINMKIERNAYGRQRESFEVELNSEIGRIKAVFIRAPIIREIGKEVEVLAELDGNPVLVKQGENLACTFHPELVKETKVHEYFVELVRKTL